MNSNLSKTLFCTIFFLLDSEVILFQNDTVSVIGSFTEYSSCKMLYICFLRMINGIIHNLFYFCNRHCVILSLHYIDSAIQCQNTHFIQFITIFLRIGLSECYQLIVDKYRKFQLRSELLLERRISSEELLQWFSLILQNYQKFSGSLLHQAIQITNGSGIQLAGLLNDEALSEIAAELMDLEQEQARLEYYISLLEPRQELVLRRTCFEKAAQEAVAEELGVTVRRVQDIKAQAVGELAEMYGLTAGRK